MESSSEKVLEGIFAVAKPAHISSADVLQKLQFTFAPSKTFSTLLASQPKRPSKSDDEVFKIGHGGTLDPLASGILIIGIGRGTKHLQSYLACKKTYETVVLFGASTDSYDCTGVITERAEVGHVTNEVVGRTLERFRGRIKQIPPVYSALKINGVKACEYAREGKELPRALEGREMQVDECEMVEWYEPGQHEFSWPGDDASVPAAAPAARIRLTVCSGFYVRSFAHDLGIACQSRSHMASLLRTRQANFSIQDPPESPDLVTAITYSELEAGEAIWGAKLRPQLEGWVEKNPVNSGHVNGRSGETKRKLAEEKARRPKQRFRGEWVAETRGERIKQQGGRFKGKWNRKKEESAPKVEGVESSESVS
ncbi:tRNA pseudouridine synthase B [Delitschia confertaspora ATCC 74209]|uniref:tRNA pseudouridine(55) synthase n=1 Tax=Delitschia confertaspora ATCC 74209 TaxID=1513339 RepID=A0A9P4JRU5_9PLEO|nr:tRNA pseudouridine synthase B [Delitschia confertaspora ATCC 74209]